jgi:nucleotide-binding universal stress UspA family protein
MKGPVLFCFDGSDGSAAALVDGGAVLARGVALVLTVWETVTTQLVSSGSFAFSFVPDESEFDQREQEAALEAARRGVREAETRGWVATARVERAPICVWQTVIDVADEVDASVIEYGTRGRNAAKRALLGSVAEAVLHHSHRPTLIAPEPDNPNLPQ